jgi:isoquinoline 1-oxidoreductase beta subunit
VGGAFGGKTVCTVELEAAVLAQTVQRPIKVQWTRTQELRHGFHRPASTHRVRATVKDGKLDQWWHAFASNHVLFTNAVLNPGLQQVTDWIGDDGVARGAALVYDAHSRRTCFDLARSPAFTGPWRGLGAAPNGVAIEVAIDACARKAGVDPLTFRLQHLSREPRLQACLKQVALLSRWNPATQRSVTPSHLLARGIACGIYKKSSYGAVVAEVEIARATGSVRVTKLWCTHDCGLVINPDQVKAQCEGNLVWSIGMVLTDKLRLEQGVIEAESFSQAPIPRYFQVPSMEVGLIASDEAPSGAGETLMACAAAAILNAIHHGLGRPLSRLPVQADEVLEHLLS